MAATVETTNVDALLRRVALFRDVPGEMRRELGHRLREVPFRAQTDIFHAGDAGATMYIIVEGAVKIFVPAIDGREVVLAVHRAGDLFGEMALLDDEPRSASASTMEDTLVFTLNRDDFVDVLDVYPAALRAIINVLVERLRATNQSIQDAYLLDVPGRLARRLLLIATEHGHDTERGRDIGLRVSQQELANMIGASRVAVNKQLQAWRQRGIVEVTRQRVVILQPANLEREFTLSP